MVGWALIVGLTVALFFFVFMAVAANPFTLVVRRWRRPTGAARTRCCRTTR